MCNESNGYNHTPECTTRQYLYQSNKMCKFQCGHVANSTYDTCCGACSNNNGPHTPDCDKRHSDVLRKLQLSLVAPSSGPSYSPPVAPSSGPSYSPPAVPSYSSSAAPSSGPSYSPPVVSSYGPSYSNPSAPSYSPPVAPSSGPSYSPPATSYSSSSLQSTQLLCANKCGRNVNAQIPGKKPFTTCCSACKTGKHTEDCDKRNPQMMMPPQPMPVSHHVGYTPSAQINISPRPSQLNTYPVASLSPIEKLYVSSGSDHLPIILLNKNIAIISFNVLRWNTYHDKNVSGQNLPFLTTQYVSTQARAYQNTETIQNVLASMPLHIDLVILCLQESTPGNAPITDFTQSFYGTTEQPIVILKNTKYICNNVTSVPLDKNKNINILEIYDGTTLVACILNTHMVSIAAKSGYATAKSTLLQTIASHVKPNVPTYVIGDLNTSDMTSPNGLFVDLVQQGYNVTDTNVHVFGNPIPKCTHRAAGGNNPDVIYDHIVEITQ